MENSQALESIFQLVHKIKREIHRHIEQLDLGISPMHVRVLKILDRKKTCTAIELASFLKRDKAQITRLLNLLIEQDLILKQPNPQDKRSQHLVLTSKGEEIMLQVRDIDKQLSAKLGQGILDDEMAQFNAVARKIVENLGE